MFAEGGDGELGGRGWARGAARRGCPWVRENYAHTRGQHRATDGFLLETQDNLTDLQIQGSDLLFIATVGLGAVRVQ